jgi:hypothetical protein
MPIDLDSYREAAESFISEIDREYYLQGAGHKAELELEPIYARHAWLFEPDAVAGVREVAGAAAPGEEQRRLRYLLGFALDGCIGEATKREAEEIAMLEATLEVETEAGKTLYRQVAVEQANEPDAARRAGLEEARDELLVERLNPLHRSALERAHELCRELGWDGYAAAYADVRNLDLEALGAQTAAFLEATADAYPAAVDPLLRDAELPALGELRRSDIARFFRAPDLDRHFPADSLVGSLEATLTGLGIDLGDQENVHLDTEPRETKSPRAFCSPVRVPGEVYLVIAPVGGRDDYAALFHEAGHTQHYASVDASMPFEFRHLGDNSVTESFAFLLEGLTESSTAWLESELGADDASAIVAQARATRFVFLRRYAAKLAYELELHAPTPDLAAMPGRYAERLGSATRIRWTEASWVSDVDPGFYVACYLRAWALETHWRRALRERFGERWFASAEAGDWLRRLWSHGQHLDADELLSEELGESLDFAVMVDDLQAAAG